MIFGHSVTWETYRLVPGIPRHVVCVREPAAALASYYNDEMHWRRRRRQPILDFDTWYDRSKRGNMMTRWLWVHFMQQPDPGEVDQRVLDAVIRTLHAYWRARFDESRARVELAP